MFGLTETHILWIAVFAFFLFVNYQINDIRSQLKPRLKPKVKKALLWSDPIVVKHATPRSLTPDGKTRWGAEDNDFKFFNSFWYFADWINKLYSDLSEPIRLQELEDTSIKGSLAREAPAYGRRYDIYYNQCKIGLLEVCADCRFHPQNPLVDVEITIDRIPPTELPYSCVWGFLQTVASLVASTEKPKYDHLPDGETEYENALSEIRAAITQHMWGMHDNDKWFSELQVRLSGTPDHYYHLLKIRLEQERPKTPAEGGGV